MSQDFNGTEEQSFSDRLELYIGCSFTLLLVAFTLPELFVSLGGVAVGIVLRWFNRKCLCAGAGLKVALASWGVLSLGSTEGQCGREVDRPVFMNLVSSQFFSLPHLPPFFKYVYLLQGSNYWKGRVKIISTIATNAACRLYTEVTGGVKQTLVGRKNYKKIYLFFKKYFSWFI